MCCWHQWFEDSWVSVLRDSRFLVNGGSNLYNMKTNLHPFDGVLPQNENNYSTCQAKIKRE